MVPGEGWWNMTATETSFDDPRQLENPDTILIAGWVDTVVEGYDRDLTTGRITVVAASDLPRVPIDPSWPEEWIIVDATSFDLLDTLVGMGAPGDTPETPVGFEPVPDADAAAFENLGSPVGLTTESVLTDGDIIGVTALDSEGNGFALRFDTTDAQAWFSGDSGDVVNGPDAFELRVAQPDNLEELSLTGIDFSGECGFVISGRASTPDTELIAQYIVEELPTHVASLCEER
jgi:hypothetical protein